MELCGWYLMYMEVHSCHSVYKELHEWYSVYKDLLGWYLVYSWYFSYKWATQLVLGLCSELLAGTWSTVSINVNKGLWLVAKWSGRPQMV